MVCCSLETEKLLDDRLSLLESIRINATNLAFLDEPHHEKTCLWGFQQGLKQTGLFVYRK